MSEPRHSATPATDQQQVICATAATGSSAFNFQAPSADISFSGGARGHHAASDDASNQSSATLDAPNLTLADPRVLSSGSSSAQVEVEETTPSQSTLPLAPQSASRLSTVTFPTPNANQLFDWSFPGTVLVPPSGPEDTSTSSMRLVGRGTKRQTAITRKRQNDLTTPHFGLVESRINPPSFFSMQRRRGETPKHWDEVFDIDSIYLPEAIPRTIHPKDAAPEIPAHLRCHSHGNRRVPS
ncbi:hypothetical protein CPB85DRAFT_267039 [Mucidula mucida]|nr:hypothetical protein CPB85DRAFT_267039 [Mucidula mucida]